MKRSRINFKLIVLVFLTSVGCRSQKIDNFGIFRESAKIKLLFNNNFEYYFFIKEKNTSDWSIKYYCNGVFKQLSDKKYILEPNKFNPDSIDTDIDLKKRNSNQKLHLIFNTGIKGDKKNEYKIIVYYGARNIQFKGTTIDATLDAIDDSILRFEILLPNYYVKNQPSPIYNKLSTANIYIGNAKAVSINTSITKEYFYYQNQGAINIEEGDTYYLINKKQILKR